MMFVFILFIKSCLIVIYGCWCLMLSESERVLVLCVKVSIGCIWFDVGFVIVFGKGVLLNLMVCNLVILEGLMCSVFGENNIIDFFWCLIVCLEIWGSEIVIWEDLLVGVFRLGLLMCCFNLVIIFIFLSVCCVRLIN